MNPASRIPNLASCIIAFCILHLASCMLHSAVNDIVITQRPATGTGASVSRLVTPSIGAIGIGWPVSVTSPLAITLGSGLSLNSSGVLSSSGGGLTVGTSTVTSGTDGYVLYNNEGTLGNKATSTGGNGVGDDGKIALYNNGILTGSYLTATDGSRTNDISPTNVTINNNGSTQYARFQGPDTLTGLRVYKGPDVSGTLITTGDTGTVTSTMLAGSIAPSKITGTAAILGANTFTGVQTLTPSARTSGSASYFGITTPADTTLAASTESVGTVISGDIAQLTSCTAAASTDLVTKTAHGLATGAYVVLTATTGGAGLAAGTGYFVINVSSSTFKLATTAANALASTAIDITSDGSAMTFTPHNTRQFATGTLTLQRERVFEAPIYGFVGASTATQVVNVDIADPIAGPNATFTKRYALRTGSMTSTLGIAAQGGGAANQVPAACIHMYYNGNGNLAVASGALVLAPSTARIYTTGHLNPNSDGSYDVGESGAQFRNLYLSNDMKLGKTITAGGTTGAQTINKPTGSVNFAAGASTLVVTNSLVATTSVVTVQVEGTDATATSARVTLASGSFTITLNAAATAETKVSFRVTN